MGVQDNTMPTTTDEPAAIPHKVLHVGIPFYTDQECRQQVPNATILILEPIDPDDDIKELDVVPTTRHYQVGQLVQWLLYKDNVWEECWYRNPETGAIERAWKRCVEFTGPVLSDKAVAELVQQQAPGKGRIN